MFYAIAAGDLHEESAMTHSLFTRRPADVRAQFFDGLGAPDDRTPTLKVL
jgi:hypothetical protein